MKQKTILIFGDGLQLTLDGKVNIEDMVGFETTKEISEVVDDILVHTYTVKMKDDVARQHASFFLSDCLLQGDNYYKAEDSLVAFLCGEDEVLNFPEHSYLECALKFEILERFSNEDLDFEDIQNLLLRLMSDLENDPLNMAFIISTVKHYLRTEVR